MDYLIGNTNLSRFFLNYKYVFSKIIDVHSGTPSVYLDETIVEMLTDILKILLSGQILSKFGTTIFSNHKPSRSAAVSFFDL